MKSGKYTLESFAKIKGISKQSALNLLSKLKKGGYVSVEGGGSKNRIYSLSILPKGKTNGFYDLVNKYSLEKLYPKFDHFVYGRYGAERAIIDGIKIGDIRTLNATMHLFRHVRDWKGLFELARKEKLKKKVIELYKKAKAKTRVGKIPKRYL